jgi:hypothetical protein
MSVPVDRKAADFGKGLVRAPADAGFENVRAFLDAVAGVA